VAAPARIPSDGTVGVRGLGAIATLRARAAERWRLLKEQRRGVAHVVGAYQHYKSNHGDHLAAAITYFSFLALFPLVLLGVSILGFVLASAHGLQQDLIDGVARNVPGAFGETITKAIDTAVNNRAGVGVLGLAGVALAGLGWVANLRTAIDTVWGLPEKTRSFVAAKLGDSIVLLGLGLGVVISVGPTAGGTAAGGYLLRIAGLDGVTGAGTATAILAIVLGILGSCVVFGWLLIRLPQVQVSRRTAVRSTLLAAVGFEVLKIVGTYYIARVTKSPVAAVIGPVVGVLVWIDLVSRYLLFCVAWAATARRSDEAAPIIDEVPSRTPAPDRPERAALSPLGVAAGLLSAGAALGATGLAALQRTRTRARARQR